MTHLIAAMTLLGLMAVPALAAEPPQLTLEAKIALGKVSGRMDHFAIDRAGQRLFLAELGNDTVSVIDLRARKVVRRITGLNEPQGVAYAPETSTLFVANGGDGAIRVFRTDDFSEAAKIALKDDADNLRIDSANHLLFAGFGSGALAVIDTTSLQKKSELPLKKHPEGFQLDPTGNRVFVNIPDAQHIAVLDRTTGQQLATWQAPGHNANFPMAVRADGRQVLIVYRSPARVVVFEATDGRVLADLPTCTDADDIFVDERRSRVYVSCGEGAIDILEFSAGKLTPRGRVQTMRGARTSFYDPESDRLFLAVRESGPEPAAVWIFKP